MTVLFLNKYFTKPLHFFGLIGFILSFVGPSLQRIFVAFWKGMFLLLREFLVYTNYEGGKHQTLRVFVWPFLF